MGLMPATEAHLSPCNRAGCVCSHAEDPLPDALLHVAKPGDAVVLVVKRDVCVHRLSDFQREASEAVGEGVRVLVVDGRVFDVFVAEAADVHAIG